MAIASNYNSPSGGIPPKENGNYNFACAREENPIPVDKSSDPDEIAVRAFNGVDHKTVDRCKKIFKTHFAQCHTAWKRDFAF